jgi:putative ABC transport system permease protein
MGIPILQGRDFTAADNVGTAPMRFVVNQAFVEKYLANERPLEKSISVDMDPKGNPFGQIIGVVGDVKEGELTKEPVPTVYYVHAHLPYTVMVFVLRANSPLTLAGSARKAIQEVDAEEPIADVRTMEEVLGETLGRQRFSAVLLAGFSLTSVLLAAVGIYGVLAYSVSQRTREIGVRVALGAEPGRILRLIVGGGAGLVLAGAAIGVASALALSGVLKSLLFGISPRDPLSFILAPLLLIAVALIAAYLPARRASLLAPMEALRTE